MDGLITTGEHGEYCLSDQGKEAVQNVQTKENAVSSVPEPKIGHRGFLKSTQFPKLIAVLLALALVAVSVVAVFDYTQLRGELASQSSVAWERDLYARFGSFAVADGKTFTSTWDGNVYCFDEQSGQALWEQNIGGYVMSNAIFVSDGRVYASSRGQTVNCLDENDGKILWKFTPYLTSSLASKTAPVFSVVNGIVFISGEGFHVLEGTHGDLRWEYLPNSALSSIGSWAVDDDGVFVGDSGKLLRLNVADGSIVWEYPISVNSPPIVGDGQVLVWNHDKGTVTCFDESEGQFLWQFNASTAIFQPILYNGLLLFGGANGNFYALTEVGVLKWTFEGRAETYDYPSSARPTIFNDNIIVAYEADHVTSIGLPDGKLVWRTAILGNALSFTLGNDELFVTSGDSRNVCTIGAVYGEVRNVQIFQYWTLPPIFADGRLYMAADGKVIAYKQHYSAEG